MRKCSVFISALVAACYSMPTYAATVTWDPEEATSLTSVIGSVWTQPGDHTVNIPSGNFIDQSYGDWGAQLIFENMGTRSAGNTITIQGAGKTASYLGNGSTGNNSGFLRVNNLNFSGITFKDISLAVGGAHMIGSSASSYGVTFNNADVFLASQSTELVGKLGNGGGGVGITGAFKFEGNSALRVNSVEQILFRSEAGFASMPRGGFTQFSEGTGISLYDSAVGGAYAFGSAAMLNTANYSFSALNIDSLYFHSSIGGVPSDPNYQAFVGDALYQGNLQTFNVEGQYVTHNLGDTTWSGGLVVAPVPEPASVALLGMAGVVGAVALRRRKKK